jgi:VWFA-related protein
LPREFKPVEKKQEAVVPPPPTVTPRPADVRRTIALLVDDLSLSFESVYYTRRALKKFVDEQMQDGDLVAIIRTGAGVGALQQFTSDKRMLYAAIERVKWNMMGSAGISAFAPIEPTPLETQQGAGDTTITDEDIQDEKNRIKSDADERNSKFAAGTLGAISYVVNGMTELPGRKFAILFSDGFPLTVSDRSGGNAPSDILEPLRRLIDLANRSSVVVYTLDPRGLQYTGLTAADNVGGSSLEMINSKLAERRDALFDSQSGLAYLANGTGGFAFKNNNDLSLGLTRVLDDQSYYLVGYEPDTDTFNPATRKFNSISVKVSRKDVNVRYRSGFFNVADTKRIPVAENLTPLQRLEKALYSPFAINDISMRLNTLFGSDAANVAFVRSLLHIDAGKFKFTDEPDGTKKASFSVLAASFGDNGALVDQLGKTYTLRIKGDVYNKVLAEGIVYHFKFPVKKPGAYQYRVAIHDTQGGALGSASQFIEVPDLKRNRLTLSSIVIENLTVEQYNRTFDLTEPLASTDPMLDTAIRRARAGGVIRWGCEIYNAKLNNAKLPDLKTRIRVFREGKLILDGKDKPFELAGQTDIQHLKTFGAFSIGSEMEPGDYVLQVIVTDGLAKVKSRIASQYIQFEVVDR